MYAEIRTQGDVGLRKRKCKSTSLRPAVASPSTPARKDREPGTRFGCAPACGSKVAPFGATDYGTLRLASLTQGRLLKPCPSTISIKLTYYRSKSQGPPNESCTPLERLRAWRYRLRKWDAHHA